MCCRWNAWLPGSGVPLAMVNIAVSLHYGRCLHIWLLWLCCLCRWGGDFFIFSCEYNTLKFNPNIIYLFQDEVSQVVYWCNWNWGAIIIIVVVYMLRVRVSHCRTILCGVFKNYLIPLLQQSEQGACYLTRRDYFTKTLQNVSVYEAEILFSFSVFYLEQYWASGSFLFTAL